MKKLFLKPLVVAICAVALFSCSEETMVSPEIETEESALLNVFSTCNMFGSSEKVQNAIQNYTVSTDVIGAEYSWEIVYGTATIVSGGSSSTASVQMGDDCTDVLLRCNIDGELNDCSETILIGCIGDPPATCDYYLPSISVVNGITGESNTVCSGQTFYARTHSLDNDHTVKWTISPSITGNGSTSPYPIFTDVSAYSQYRVTATFYCSDGLVSGARALTINQTSTNCDWDPI